MEERVNSSNILRHSASREPEDYVVPMREHDYQNGFVNVNGQERIQSPQYQRPTNHGYEHPENRQSQPYEYPFLGNEQTNVTENAEDSGYAQLIRQLRNRNESEDSGYTSLIKAEGTIDQEIGAMGIKGNEDGKQDDDNVIDGHYTPLARRRLTEAQRYQSLIKDQNGKENSKVGVTGTREEAEGLSYVDVS